MHDAPDMDLIQQFAQRNSDEAFATLVRRHVNMVYSAALRKTGNPHAAEEITQAVFIILAKKAGNLRAGTVLSGWLYQTARLTSASFLRTEIRRAHREQEAYMQSLSNETDPNTWLQIAPHLEDAMGQLGEKDRNAIALRFFEGKSFQEVGTAFGASENAAKKRVAYALEKLRKYFSKRGIVSTTAIIAGVVSANSVQAAPSALATSISTVAIAKGAAVSGSTLTLVKGALKLMAWTKMKIGIVAGASVLLAAGIATETIKAIHNHRTYSWQVFYPESEDLIMEKTTPQITIVPTKFPQGSTQGGGTGDWSWTRIRPDGTVMGINCTALEIIRFAYSKDLDFIPKGRFLVKTDLPDQGYDFIANLKSEVKSGLQHEMRKKFGLTGSFETHMAEVLALEKVSKPGGVKPAAILKGVMTIGEGDHWIPHQASISGLAEKLEHYLQIPVVDETEITNRFDLSLRWTTADVSSGDDLKKILINRLDQIGLQLVPANMPIELLVVEKVK